MESDKMHCIQRIIVDSVFSLSVTQCV